MPLAKPIALMAVLFAALLWFVSPSHAMPMCGLRADFIKTLENQFKERAIAMALTGKVNVVEVFISKTGSTWTMLITDPNGRTCMFGAGQNWKKLNPEIEGEPL